MNQYYHRSGSSFYCCCRKHLSGIQNKMHTVHCYEYRQTLALWYYDKLKSDSDSFIKSGRVSLSKYKTFFKMHPEITTLRTFSTKIDFCWSFILEIALHQNNDLYLKFSEALLYGFDFLFFYSWIIIQYNLFKTTSFGRDKTG